MNLASRLRMTEGQLQSAVITLIIAVLLLFGLGDLHGVIGTAIAEQPLALAPQTPAATIAPTVPVQAPVALPQPLPLTPQGEAPLPAPAPAPAPEPTYVAAPDPTYPPIAASPSPKPTPCSLQTENDAAVAVVKQVNDASGGQLPSSDLLAVIGTITGCDPADPKVVAIGLLIGIGHTLPDPGLPNPLPPVPYVPLPGAVVTALQPARSIIDPACGTVGLGPEVASLFISAYPQPVPQTVSSVMFQVLALCGQVQAP